MEFFASEIHIETNCIYYHKYSNKVATYGQEWEVGDATSSVPYRAGQKHVFIAHISIKIGLRSINITLEEKSYDQVGHSPINQLIKYNEQFLWTWDQGRYGFGPNGNTYTIVFIDTIYI